MAELTLFAMLHKLGASRARMSVSQTRSGRRSMRVDTMLRKDKEGTLWKDHLPGGLADKKKPSDFPAEKLREGRAVEKEHTSNPAIQTEIAMDHITEDPNYYPKLKRMEAGEKQAGLGDLLKTPIPGTKDWFVNTGRTALQGAGRMSGKVPVRPGALRTAANSVAPAVRASGTMPAVRGGVHGISEAELQRLGFGDLLKQGAADPDFEAFQAKLKPGDILMTRAVKPTLMSKIISGVQHSEFGHSAIYAGDGKVIDTRNHGKGVFQTSLSEVYKKWGGGRDIRAYAPKATKKMREAAVSRARELIGTPYHTMGAFRMLFPAGKNKGIDPNKKPKAVICSEVVARAYPDLHFAQRKNRAHVLPVDIAKSPLVRRKGELKFKDPMTEKKAYTLQGHTEVQGLPISIENRKGSVRKGVDPDGKPWRTKYKIPYGYLTGTKGNDGEAIDVYVGPDKTAPNAFVIHQHKITGKGYDEDKVMLGFQTEDEARKAYLEHYNSVGKKLLGPITVIAMKRLAEMLAQKKERKKLATADISNNTLMTEQAGPTTRSKPGDVPDALDVGFSKLKHAWDGVGSGGGPTGNRMAMLDLDEKPDRTKPGDVPSRDGTSPGAARIERHEAGPDFMTTLPTNGAQSSSGTGATTRL